MLGLLFFIARLCRHITLGRLAAPPEIGRAIGLFTAVAPIFGPRSGASYSFGELRYLRPAYDLFLAQPH